MLDLRMPSMFALLAWAAFAVVLVSATILYGRPTRFAGPIVDSERRAGVGLRAWLRWLAIPVSTLAGFWLLLRPVFSGSFEYWSLTGSPGASEPPALRCAVEQVLVEAEAAAASSRGSDRRRRLAEAVVEAAGGWPDVRCPAFPPRDGYTSAEVESVEITLLMLLARAGELASVTVHPGPLYAEVDAWALAKTAIDPWATLDLERDESESSAEIHKIDRVIAEAGGGSRMTLWAVGSRTAICDGQPTPHVLEEPSVACRVVPPPVCTLRVDADELAAEVAIECDGLSLPAADKRTLQWGNGQSPIHRSASGTVRVVPEDSTLYDEARALVGTRDAFGQELRASGLILPERGDGRVVLDLDGDEVRVHLGDPRRCEDGAGMPDPHDGPFSWHGIKSSGRAVRVFDDCVIIGIHPDVLKLDVPDLASRVYEPSSYYATLRSIAWATSCVEQGCGALSAFAPSHEYALPLLSQGEMDEAIGAAARMRESLGVALIALSLLLAAASYLRSARR